MLRNQTIELQPSFESVANAARTLHINASAASGLTYSPESASTVITNLFKWLGDLAPDMSKLGFSPKKTTVADVIAKKLDANRLIKVAKQPITVQDGLEVTLPVWIATLDKCYSDLIGDLNGGLEGLLSLFGKLTNNPDEIKNLSRYGHVEKSTVDRINTEFQNMFGSAHRSARVTLGQIIPSESDASDVSVYYDKLIETRGDFNNEEVKEKIVRINELAKEFIEKFGLRISGNRRAVSDLAAHVSTVADAVSLLSNLDYSFQVLENTMEAVKKAI